MHQDAFNELKRLCDEAVPLKPLKYRDIKKGKTNVFLVTDASKIGVGAFICHGNVYEDARNNIAALHSRKFTSAQEHYMTTEQECLAMVDALKAFETRLLGIPFTIITDHQALQFILNSEIKTYRQIRWLEYMQRFNFTIKYAPGSTNILADALSRIYAREKEFTGKKLKKVVNMDLKDLEEREYGTMRSIKASGNSEEDSSNDNYLPTDFQNSSAFTSYGSMAPRRPTNDAGLHWKFCQLKDARCPFHGTTGIFVSDSRWVDQISYNRRIKEWDEQHGSAGAASSSTVNPSNTTVVRGGLSEVSKRARRRRRQLERGDPEPPSESLREIEDKGRYTDLDEDGYPRKLRIRWKSINKPGGEDSAVAAPSSGNMNLRIATSHVITRSKARKITSPKDTGGGSWIEVQNPKPTRFTHREVANLEEMAAGMEAKTADDAETEIEHEVMAEEVAEGTDKGKAVEEEMNEGKTFNEDWVKDYTKDLIIPESGLPSDLVSGIIRVVDGKQYRLDDYASKMADEKLTPLEVNIYNAGHTDASQIPQPFRGLNYTTPFGKAFFTALGKDPVWTACRRYGGQPYSTHRLGFVIFQRPGKVARIYIPEGLYTNKETGAETTVRTVVIDQAHKELGYLGTAKTYLRLAPMCVWPKMYKDVKDYVRTCHECQVNKWPTTRPAGRAHVLPIPERPWQSIAIDFEGPLTVSQGYSAIMVVMDRFSGFLLCYPIKNKFSAVDVADTFMATFYGRYLFPESIVSDRDSRFTGKFWAALQKTLGIELLMATAFH
jgi:hypothetical protein